MFSRCYIFSKRKINIFRCNRSDIKISSKKDGPVITENGNLIIDAKFANIDENFEKELKCITGVIETGLFIGYNIEVIK